MVTVIICCGSNHHLISGLAYVDKLKQLDDLIILTDGFLGVNYNPEEKFLEKIKRLYRLNIRVFDFEIGLKCLESNFNSEMRSVIYITPRFFSINVYLTILKKIKRKSCSAVFKWIESEEGIGSYETFFYRLNHYRATKDYKNLVKSFFNKVFGIFFVETKIRLISSSFYFDIDRLDSVRRLYKFIYTEKYKFDGLGYNYKGIMLYASTPAVEENLLTKDHYLDFIYKIRLHARSKNLLLLIKPHPSEDLSKYPKSIVYKPEWTVFEKILVNDDRIKAVAAICSTILYTTKIIKNIDTYIYVNQILNDRFYNKKNKHLTFLKDSVSHFVIV